MPEIAGSLQPIEPLRALPLLVLVPLLACTVLGLLGPWLSRRGLGRAIAERLGIGNVAVTFIAWGASFSTLAVAVHAGLRLAALAPERRFFYAHLWPVVHLGSVQIDLGLALDPLSTVVATMIAVVGIVAHLAMARSQPDDATYPWSFASLQLLVFSALLVVVAADLMTTLIGWQTMSFATFLLVQQRHARSDAPSPTGARSSTPATRIFVVNTVGDAAFVGGILLLLWGLGGSWLEGGAYQPDNLPRLAAVRSEPQSAGVLPAPPGSAAELSMGAFAGARVYLEEATIPLASSPFLRVPVAPGDHVLRVAIPGARDEELLFDARPGSEVVVVTTGPTLSYRELYDRMTLTDARGRHLYENDWTMRSLGGHLGLGTAICLAFLLAAATKCAVVPFFAGTVDAIAAAAPLAGFVQGAASAAIGVYLLARLGPLFAMSPDSCTVVVFAGSATALIAALASIFQPDVRRVLACVAASQLGLVFLGLGEGAHGLSLLHLVVNGVAQTFLWLGADALMRIAAHRDRYGVHQVPTGDLRTMSLQRRGPAGAWLYAVGAAVLSASPLPLVLGFASKNANLWHAIENRQLGNGARAIVGATALVASVAAAFAVWRTYFVAFEGELDRDAPNVNRAGQLVPPAPASAGGWLLILAPACLGGGLLLGSPRAWFDSWLSPVLLRAHFAVDDLGKEREQAAAALALVFGLAAFFSARARYGKGRSADWAERESRLPLAAAMRHAFYVDALCRVIIERPLMRAERVLSDIDEWVVEGWTSALAFGIRALGAGSLAVDRALFDAGSSGTIDDPSPPDDRARRRSFVRVASYLVALLLGALLALLARRLIGR